MDAPIGDQWFFIPVIFVERDSRVLTHPAQHTDAPLARVLLAGAESERPIFVARPPSAKGNQLVAIQELSA